MLREIWNQVMNFDQIPKPSLENSFNIFYELIMLHSTL